MKAAIYARKSTDDSDRIEDNKSVTRQIESAKAFAIANGWTVNDENIFIDDNISGAEFKNRPALLRMLNHLREFDVIVMSELSRLGREQSETSTVIAKIVAKGVRVFFYLDRAELKFDSALEKFMVNAVSFGSELEREKASQRSRDALERKAKHGYNTGGIVYGYDNIPVFGTNAKGEQVKSYTDYRINESQAEVVRSIFRMYADGHGHRVIAKTLNGDSSYSELSQKYLEGQRPSPPRKGSGSWAHTSIREMLRRERYRGVVPFGEYRKVLREGTTARIIQPDYLRTERPDLLIVPPELWERVQARIRAEERRYMHRTDGKLESKPDTGRAAKYLLTGVARCEVCGGTMIVSHRPFGNGHTRRGVPFYICGYRHNRGETVCANDHRERVEAMDTPILEAVEALLTPQAVSDLIDMMARRVQELRQEGPDKVKRLQAEQKELAKGLKNLLELAIGGGAPKTINAEIAAREQRLEAIERELTVHLGGADPDALGRGRVRQMCQEQAKRFRKLMYSDMAAGRQALRRLNLNVRFFPTVKDGRKSLDFYGTVDGRLLLEPTVTCMASPRGFEPRSPP